MIRDNFSGRIVIDTNVIVSALLTPYNKPAQIVSALLIEKLTLCISEPIFEEYAGVLNRPKFKKLNRDRIQGFLLWIKNVSVWVSPDSSIDVIDVDPADNKFLECALEASADYLITGNRRHFPMDSFQGIKIVTPAEFLSLP